MDEGIANLAAVFHEHNSRVTEAMTRSLRLDFGEIQENYHLKLDTFDKMIPKDAWSVCRRCTQGNPIRPGQRVLAAWVGNEPVVIDAVFSAAALGAED